MKKSRKRQQISQRRKEINDFCEENELLSMQQNRNRARSITVGTAFGGVLEIHMRSDIGSVYAQLQPTEALELAEQITAGCGVEIAMRPKQNFASWRGWEEVIDGRIPTEQIAWKGAAPWQLEMEEQRKLKSTEEKDVED